MSVYDDITKKIIEAIENGDAKAEDWQMPWHRMSGRPVNVLTGKAYQGVNTLNLWIEAQARCFHSAEWGTFRQWKEKEAKVKKGAKGSLIVFWKPLPAKNDDEEASDRRFVLKSSVVFNASQVDGYYPELQAVSDFDPLPDAERFVGSVEALDLRYGGSSAFYHQAQDFVQMPPRGDFYTQQGFYATLLHEMAHWTGHTSRLDRQFGKRFGDEAYAFEELVAELSAAFLCADLGISSHPRFDHSAYVASWLKVLKNDSRAIFTAATAAQKATEFLSSFSDTEKKSKKSA